MLEKTNDMTRSQIFTDAHAMAKAWNWNEYRAAFSCALSMVYARLRTHWIKIEAWGSVGRSAAPKPAAKKQNDQKINDLTKLIEQLNNQKQYKQNYIDTAKPNTKTSSGVCRAYANRQRRNHKRVYQERIEAFKMDIADYDQMIIKHTDSINNLSRMA